MPGTEVNTRQNPGDDICPSPTPSFLSPIMYASSYSVLTCSKYLLANYQGLIFSSSFSSFFFLFFYFGARLLSEKLERMVSSINILSSLTQTATVSCVCCRM